MAAITVKLIISAIGTLLGVAAFICFCLVYANIEAGMWALLSGIKAAMSFTLHFHYMRDTLHAKFPRRVVSVIRDIGLLGFVSGTALTIFYVFLQLYWQTPVMPVDTSIVIRMVWSFMMMKWGFLLFRDARGYLHTYTDHQLGA